MTPPLPEPPFRLLAVSAGRADEIGAERWLGAVRPLGEAGVGGFEVREKALSDRRLYELTRRARALLPAATRVLVNGRADVALAAGADGVHLPAAGVPAAALRRRFDRRLLIGCSTHSLEEVEAAYAAGADYVVFGPVFPTPSKPSATDLPGLSGLARAARVGIPVLALGGVDLPRLADVAGAGARGAAGIRMFADVSELPALVERAREVFS